MEASPAILNSVSPHTPTARESYRDLRFMQVFEAAAVGIALCHFDGRILEGNAALARLLGYEPEELTGLDPWQFHSADDSSRLLADLLRGARDWFAIEKRCRCKGASELWGRLTVSLARHVHRDPAFLVVLLEDATERKRLEEQLHQAEKMELIGRLTGGIAHDFNNLLTGFLLYCDLLLSELEGDHRLRRQVEEIRQAGEQGAALTQQLLAISRKHAASPRPVALNEVVCTAENLLRRLIGEQIELRVDVDPAASLVFADPTQLRQILLNLVLNSRDALKHGGRIHVRTRTTRFPAKLHADGAPAVSLIVEDNGCGMTAEIRAHLFEPFFTTKLPGEGTGMGMATVHRIATEAGGAIEVASEPGRGTRIEVFFPQHEPEVIGSSGDRGIGSSLIGSSGDRAIRSSEERIVFADSHAIDSSDDAVQIGRSPDDPITRSGSQIAQSPDDAITRSPDDEMIRSLPAHQFPSPKGDSSC